MQEDWMRCIMSGIKRFELTLAEKEFIAFAEQNLNQHGPIMKTIELIAEGIYWQKTQSIRNSVVCMFDKEKSAFGPGSVI